MTTSRGGKTPESSYDIVIRKGEAADAEGITSLLNPDIENVFGRINVLKIIERSLTSVSVLSTTEEVLAYGAFSDKPNQDISFDWLPWLNQYYEVAKLNSINTVFLHLFVANPDFSSSLAPEIINYMFSLMPHVHYCLFLVPRGLFPDKGISSFFEELPLRAKDVKPDRVLVFIANRSPHVPVLHVRTAKPEDNDDLVPLFNAQSDHLRSTYGEFYLAELVEAQDDSMKCLVVENDNKAVGFVSVTANVDVDGLESAFYLEPYNGLRKLLSGSPIPIPSHAKTTGKSSKKSTPKTVGSPKIEGENISTEAVDNEADHAQDQEATGEPAKEEQSVELREGAAEAIEKDVGEEEREEATAGEAEEEEEEAEEEYEISKGPVNAVCIQLFSIGEGFEARSVDFLPRIFEFFPDREYIVMGVPHLTPEFELLKNFVRVPPRPNAVVPQQLYIYSKYGLLSSFNVRPMSSVDYSSLQHLVNTLELNEPIMEHVKMYMKYRRNKESHNNALQVFVGECATQIISVAVVEQEKNIEYLRSHYNIEDFIFYNHHRYEEHGHIWHLAVNPAFSCLTRIFLKEIMRLGKKTCLYYPIYPDNCIQKAPAHSVACCLLDLVPVPARRQPPYCLKKLGINAPSQAVLRNQVPFALYHTNTKLCFEPKHGVNARVVVVGASDTGLATLERLVMTPHLLFHNLTLLSTHGLPVAPVSNDEPSTVVEDPDQPTPSPQRNLAERFLPKTANVDGLHHSRGLYLRCAVNSVPGRMTAVNRTKKYLVVDGSYQLPYDYLVLATGHQYQIPEALFTAVRGTTGLSITSPMRTRTQFIDSPMPTRTPASQSNSIIDNCFTINDMFDADQFTEWVPRAISSGTTEDYTPRLVVIYGRSIDAYTTLDAVVEFGFPPKDIVFVLTPLDEDEPTCFNNPDVENAIHSRIDAAGVNVFVDYTLTNFSLRSRPSSQENAEEQGTIASSLSFEQFGSGDVQTVNDVLCLLSFDRKAIAYDTFRALNNACLVMDGRLVVDPEFHTNDPAIRAAGSLTKYSRKLYADRVTHDLFNPREVGIELAHKLLLHFDPLKSPSPIRPPPSAPLPPLFEWPRIIYAENLPFGFRYLQVERPGPRVRLEDQLRAYDYGDELVTGSTDNSNYLRLHLNMNETVETITCLSDNTKDITPYVCLFGVHERYMNSLKGRWDEKLITDLYDYFSESWAVALFHDRLRDLRDEIRQIFATESARGDDGSEQGFETKLREYIGSDIQMTRFLRKFIADNYRNGENTELKKSIERRLLNYLEFNSYHLPMYAKTGVFK